MLSIKIRNRNTKDIIQIKTGLNQLIENNNQQRKLNSRFEKTFKRLNPQSIFKESILTDNELLTSTINFAKAGIFLSGTLNLRNVHEVIKNELYDILIINVLKHSDIYIHTLIHTINE